jgi:sec-independent protein translocase protein TatA
MFTDLLQPTHLLIVMVVALIFLGPKRLPGAGRALGQGLREFKQSITGAFDEHSRVQGTASDDPELSASVTGLPARSEGAVQEVWERLTAPERGLQRGGAEGPHVVGDVDRDSRRHDLVDPVEHVA